VEDSEEEVVLLSNLKNAEGKFYIYNSFLSEYGVLGFDYG
jgi:2-oxoglutarate dehydrogenase E1 component